MSLNALRRAKFVLLSVTITTIRTIISVQVKINNKKNASQQDYNIYRKDMQMQMGMKDNEQANKITRIMYNNATVFLEEHRQR